jgi:hypothetical protein
MPPELFRYSYTYSGTMRPEHCNRNARKQSISHYPLTNPYHLSIIRAIIRILIRNTHAMSVKAISETA